MQKSCECVRPKKNHTCEWRDTYLENRCIILTKGDRPCIDEEKIMAEKELLKEKGKVEYEEIDFMLNKLTKYLDEAPTTDIMDRVNDACGHLRKARLFIKNYYGL